MVRLPLSAQRHSAYAAPTRARQNIQRRDRAIALNKRYRAALPRRASGAARIGTWQR